MKKNYQKPAIQVVLLQQCTHILAGSGGRGAKSLSDNEYFYMKEEGFDDNDDDV